MVLGSCAGPVACKDKAKLIEVNDTEGRTITVTCTEGGSCQVGRPEGAIPEFQLRTPGRVATLCPAGPESDPVLCRPLVCRADADCPWAIGLEQGSCVNGLCTEPSHGVTKADSIALCMAGTGIGRTSPKQVELYAMAIQCGDPCKVPTVCRQL